MNYKDILTKINIEISENNRAAARAFLLSEKKTGKAAAAVWNDIISRFGSDSPIFDDLSGKNYSGYKTTTKTGKARKKENKAVSDHIEKYQGEIINPDDNINGLYMPDIENKVYQALNDFMSECGIDDMTKASQRQFQAFSMYVGRNVFKPSKILKKNNPLYNEYDLEKMVAVLNLYVFICQKYNKAFTLDGGAYFCGVSDNYITEHKEKLTLLNFDPNKKAEQTIAAGLLDGKINPTGSIAWLNYNAKWATPSAAAPAPAVNVTVYPVLNAPAAAPALPDNGDM